MSINTKKRPIKELPAARLAAKAKGATRYFDPTPCLRGHISLRYTCNGGCTSCHAEKRGHPYTGPKVDVTRWNNIKAARLNALRAITDLKKRIDGLQNKAETCHTRLHSLIKTLAEGI